jgi:hypothetical protein
MRVVCTVAVCAALASAAAAASAATLANLPPAFERAPTAADELPAGFEGIPNLGLPYDARRIATASGSRRSWSVYVFKQRSTRNRVRVCFFVLAREPDDRGGWGGGCSPSGSFFGPGRDVHSSAMNSFFAGVASSRVERVVIVGAAGVVRELPLTRDNGFTFNCPSPRGCGCFVSRIQAFDRQGRRVENQAWRPDAPNCRRR